MAEATSALIHDLCQDDEFRRIQAAFALGVLGELAVPPLIELLGSPEQEFRKRAAWVLGVVGVPALPALLQLAEGEDKQLRIEAIRVLGMVGEARALNQLLLGLTDSDPHVAARAARALGKVGDPRAYHPLITALQHPSPDVRYEASRALADLRVADGIQVLSEIAADDGAKTSWGASVADGARRAIHELENAAALESHTPHMDRASQIVQENPQE